MYISSIWILAWSLLTVTYIALSIQYRKESERRQRRVRDLERTIDKLKSRNGKLWYDIINHRPEPAPIDRNELTITTKLAT